MKNRQVLLARRPKGWPMEEDFCLVDTPVGSPADGQVLVRNRYLSLDPYMRMRMNDAPSYAPKVELGDVMVGGTVGEVVETRSPRLCVGDIVTGLLGWQRYGIEDASRLRCIDRPVDPLSVHLGALGMPGVTAWVGLELIGPLDPDATVVVSAASGAVGSVVGQIARHRGSRTIGIAGGAEKCRHVVADLGFDACIDYKTEDIATALATTCPAGIDVYFDNVGGRIFDLVLDRLNPFARIALCGQVSQYNETEPYAARNLRSLLVNRVKLQGFIVSDHMPLWPPALKELTQWFREGTLQYRETVAEGLDNAPHAFIAMLRGNKIGKQIVKLD